MKTPVVKAASDELDLNDREIVLAMRAKRALELLWPELEERWGRNCATVLLLRACCADLSDIAESESLLTTRDFVDRKLETEAKLIAGSTDDIVTALIAQQKPD